MTAFTRDWSAAYEAIPADTDDASEGASRIRNSRVDTRERVNVDHYLPGTAPADKTEEGEHRKVTFYGPIADPSNVADKGFLYTKDVSAVVELFWQDESGNVVQLTSVGSIGVSTEALLGSGLTLTSTNAGASAGPTLTLDRNLAAAEAAVNDVIGNVIFRGADDAGAAVDYAEIQVVILDETAGTEDARMDLETMVGGTLANRFHVAQGFFAVGNADPGAGNIDVDAVFISGTNLTAIYQPLDAQLTDVAGLAVTDGGFIVGNGSNFVLETGATVRTSLGLVIGTDVMPEAAVVPQAEAEAGTATTERSWTAQRVKQAIDALAPSGPIPSGTVMLFMQAATPSTWTRLNTVNNRALRIIGTSGTGAATGGATAFDSVFGSGKTTGDDTPTLAKTFAHTHVQQVNTDGSDTDMSPGTTAVTPASGGVSTQSAGSSSVHSHTESLDLHFVNVLHCSKDA